MSYVIDNVDFHNDVEAMKYWSFPASWEQAKRKEFVNQAIFSRDYIGAHKKDGAFYKFLKNMNGEVELIGRSKGVGGDYLNKIGHVPHLYEFFNSLPCGTCLLGELYFPDQEGSRYTTTIMGCKEDKAIERQKNHHLHYYIFDVLAYDGEVLIDKPIIERIKYLDYLSDITVIGFETDIEIAKYYEGKELWDKYMMILDDGGEGVVISLKTGSYLPGKRKAKHTLKLKKELQETIDCVILDKESPTKEYSGKDIENWQFWVDRNNKRLPVKIRYYDYQNGEAITPVTKPYYYEWAGSFLIGLKKEDGKYYPIGTISGLTDEMKMNWHNYIGKVVEVTAMEFNYTDGKFSGLRHPKIIQMRDDKKKSECVWEQVEKCDE